MSLVQDATGTHGFGGVAAAAINTFRDSRRTAVSVLDTESPGQTSTNDCFTFQRRI